MRGAGYGLWPAKRRIFATAECVLGLLLHPDQVQSCSTMVNFPALNESDGLKALDEHLLTRSYITG